MALRRTEDGSFVVELRQDGRVLERSGPEKSLPELLGKTSWTREPEPGEVPAESVTLYLTFEDARLDRFPVQRKGHKRRVERAGDSGLVSIMPNNTEFEVLIEKERITLFESERLDARLATGHRVCGKWQERMVERMGDYSDPWFLTQQPVVDLFTARYTTMEGHTQALEHVDGLLVERTTRLFWTELNELLDNPVIDPDRPMEQAFAPTWGGLEEFRATLIMFLDTEPEGTPPRQITVVAGTVDESPQFIIASGPPASLRLTQLINCWLEETQPVGWFAWEKDPFVDPDSGDPRRHSGYDWYLDTLEITWMPVSRRRRRAQLARLRAWVALRDIDLEVE